VNRIPCRRVDQAYVIGTSTVVDISGIEIPAKLNDEYFKVAKNAPKKGEEGFFDISKATPEEAEAKLDAAEKEVSKAVAAAVEKVPLLKDYLQSRFALDAGSAPHLMKF